APRHATLFPYTTLFRSILDREGGNRDRRRDDAFGTGERPLGEPMVLPAELLGEPLDGELVQQRCQRIHILCVDDHIDETGRAPRSEEHTSELQSLAYHV